MTLDLQQYRHRTGAVVVTAVQLARENGRAVWEWVDDSKPYYDPDESGTGLVFTGLTIFTAHNGRQKANFGDWVVCIDGGGSWYPVLDEAFRANYEPVSP